MCLKIHRRIFAILAFVVLSTIPNRKEAKMRRQMILMLLLMGTAATAFGQRIGGPDRFATQAECEEAVRSGNFSFYIASDLRSHREPTSGESVIPLEAVACVEMDVVGGRLFVPQAKSDKFIFNGPQIVTRYDCGNKVYSITYVTPPPPPTTTFELPPLPPAPPQPTPVTIPVGPPSCIINGNEVDGLVVTMINGNSGYWLYFKEGETTSERLQGERLFIPISTLSPGKYKAIYMVTGAGGDSDCAYSWDVPPTPSTFITEFEDDIPWCDGRTDHRWFAWPAVQLRCHPIRTAIIAACVAEAIYSANTGRLAPPCGKWWHRGKPSIQAPPLPPPVETKPVPPGGVISPAATVLDILFKP